MAMASSSMIASSKSALSGVAVPRNGPFTTSRPAVASRQMMVQAQQGPKDAVMRTVGAITAAQLALLPLTGAAVADILPDSATSQSARDAVNKETDQAPGIGDVGKALTNFEGARSKAPDVEAAAKDVQKATLDKGRKAADQAADKLPSNPARDFANRVKNSVSSNPTANSFTIGAIGQPNPAVQAKNAAKDAAKKAQSVGVPDPATELANKTKAAARDAKASLGANGVPDPVKDLKNKTKQAGKKVANPAKEFAEKSKKAVKSTQRKAPAVAKKASKKIENPAKEFAAKAQKAKKKVGGPLAAIGFDTEGLQKNVIFGFGEKKPEKVASQAADKGKEAADTAAKKVDENTPNSFSIFDADSVADAKNKLKSNVDQAVGRTEDPAARVASVGKPGESQEENAERIRRESENGAPAGGDARAPTNSGV